MYFNGYNYTALKIIPNIFFFQQRDGKETVPVHPGSSTCPHVGLPGSGSQHIPPLASGRPGPHPRGPGFSGACCQRDKPPSTHTPSLPPAAQLLRRCKNRKTVCSEVLKQKDRGGSAGEGGAGSREASPLNEKCLEYCRRMLSRYLTGVPHPP